MLMLLALLVSLCAHAGWTSNLSGRWAFRIDEKSVGVTEKWFDAPLAGDQEIKLPGTMDSAGIGSKNTKPPTLEGHAGFTTMPDRRGRESG